MNKKISAIVVMAIALIVLLSPFIYNAFGTGLFSKAPRPEVKIEKEGKCVRDTEFMRRNHMNILLHAREDVVREGVRIKDDSLNNCRNCHPSRGDFCIKCHSYIGVKTECFECHYYPKKAER